ncbi:hypothetical protein A6024_18085 [Rhodovulum sulfidophilum]|nr:hypothetical protein A6W98_18280 [Rhodovulum sulfidophilum DSM 1374]ANB39653.1 hypothetical protein A6024_18085 [Rhodovulum sulfidophilum]
MQRCKKIFMAIVLALSASQAAADCGRGNILFTFCDIAGKDTVLRVCHDDFTVTYSYGVAGEVPQLYLSEAIATVDYHPWDAPDPTSGSITFRNGEYAYEVTSLFVTQAFADDIPSAAHFGWVTVTRNGEIVVKLECRPEPSRYVYGGSLYERTTAMGLEWNGYERGWTEY